MIAYFDTSALVPLLIEEPSTALCGELWDAADEVVTTRLTYVESTAALAMGVRLDRITQREHDAARRLLVELWREAGIVELDEDLMTASGDAARHCALRGYDAVHYAAAVSLDDTDLVAVTGDKNLLRAWTQAGIAVADTNAPIA